VENTEVLEGFRWDAASNLPVLTPLIGMNKAEIVRMAQDIGTYDISILPYPDCCSFMIAAHPETRSDLATIVGYEARIENADARVDECVKNAEALCLKLS